jgi:hypothetical protein
MAPAAAGTLAVREAPVRSIGQSLDLKKQKPTVFRTVEQNSTENVA